MHVRKHLLLVGILTVELGAAATNQAQEGPEPRALSVDKVEEVAAVAGKDVCVIEKVAAGATGTAVMILEEVHTCRVGQIEHAVVLNRLYERFGMRHIALEGYLRGDPALDAAWFKDAAGGNPLIRSRVAVRLLREGEISSVEFMMLIHDDLAVHPIEIAAEYGEDLDDDAMQAPFSCLIKIAQRSLVPELAELRGMQDEMDRLGGEQKAAKAKEMVDFILFADRWAQARADNLRHGNGTRLPSAQQQLTELEEIERRVRELERKPEEQAGLQLHIAFLRARVAASKTMAEETGVICDQTGTAVVAMNIGVGHTDKVCEMLGNRNRPYAVVSPASLRNRKNRADLTKAMFDRKNRGRSVYSDGFTETLLRTFGARKPRPILGRSWFQGKSELYLFTERIASGVLGQRNVSRKRKPLYGFSEQEFEGKWVAVDPKEIQTVEGGLVGAVVFPAWLNRDDPSKRTRVWVKAAPISLTPQAATETVESMLKQAIEEVNQEKQFGPRLEDAYGRIRTSAHTVAFVSATKSAAIAAELSR